jgi:hypothetical protein
MQLHYICHYVDSNTLEAGWLRAVMGENGEVEKYERAKVKSYSKPQKDDFIAEVGEIGEPYAELAGWNLPDPEAAE